MIFSCRLINELLNVLQSRAAMLTVSVLRQRFWHRFYPGRILLISLMIATVKA